MAKRRTGYSRADQVLRIMEDRGYRHTSPREALVRRIVASTDAVGLVAKAFTLTGWFREAFVALPDAGLLEPLVLAYAVRARWPIKPAAKDLIARVRQGWSSARHS